MHVVRLGLPGETSCSRISNGNGRSTEDVAVQVSQFPPSEPELDAAESVRPDVTPGQADTCRTIACWMIAARFHALCLGCSRSLESASSGPRTEYAARRGRRQQHDVGAPHHDRVAGGERRRLLHRLEVHERRLVVERRLQQVHLRLQQVALRLRDEERRRQPDLVAALLGVEPLLAPASRRRARRRRARRCCESAAPACRTVSAACSRRLAMRCAACRRSTSARARLASS